MTPTVFPAYRIFPLGDTAISIDFGNLVDETINSQVLALFDHFQNHPFPGMIEAVPAFSSITIHYDVAEVRRKGRTGQTAFEILRQQLVELLEMDMPVAIHEPRIIEVPVCYDDDFAHDLSPMSNATGLAKEEIIQLHAAKRYRVFMLGFLPGFCYMGEVDERIAMPRKSHPEHVAAGSIGIAGRQTGIYPLDSPGGWHIIGKTPLKLFKPSEPDAVLFRAGDEVIFKAISRDEFARY